MTDTWKNFFVHLFVIAPSRLLFLQLEWDRRTSRLNTKSTQYARRHCRRFLTRRPPRPSNRIDKIMILDTLLIYPFHYVFSFSLFHPDSPISTYLYFLRASSDALIPRFQFCYLTIHPLLLPTDGPTRSALEFFRNRFDALLRCYRGSFSSGLGIDKPPALLVRPLLSSPFEALSRKS